MSIAEQLAEVLAEISRPGDFFVSGSAELPLPRIEVDGVGPIALPLLPTQAKALIKVALRAPYGRGADTVVDTKVRRTWQIGAEQVRIGGKHWGKTLAGIVARAADGLGVGEPVAAELYKLLIYDKGSFFVSHRDTEKTAGMFATLVVALPSDSKGGALIVRHTNRETTIDLANSDPSEVTFAAFYADCVHEVLPITQGCRATLVFNLVRKAKGAAVTPPSYEAELEQIETLLEQWSTSVGSGIGDESSETDAYGLLKLAIPLEHAYTPAELGFDRLKGVDAAVARLLMAAAPKSGVDLNLALLKVWESGSAEYIGRQNWHYRRGRRDAGEDEDADEFEVVEVFDRSRTLSDWRRPDGAPTALAALPLADEEVVPADALEAMEPDEEHFHEATGNEGASFDRTYSRAALVLWPSSKLLAVLNQAGLGATLPYLEHLAKRARAKGGGDQDRLKAEAHVLAGHMLATWPDRPRVGPVDTSWWSDADEPGAADQTDDEHDEDIEDIEEDRTASPLARFIAALTSLGDTERIVSALDRLILQQRHEKSDNASILGGLKHLPAGKAASVVTAIVAANAVDAPGACAGLLRMAAAGTFLRKTKHFEDAAAKLVDRLPGDPASAPKDQWNRPRGATMDADLVADLVAVVDQVDPGLADRAVRHVLAWPRHFDPDKVLVPAMKKVVASKLSAGPAARALHAAAISHLEARIGLPLEAPRDWTRPNQLGCKCEYCSDLARFLADPLRESWTLRAAQQHRTHVEHVIRRAPADVDQRTERKGSPHSLICRKNQASYERRVKQRRQDIADREALTTPPQRKRGKAADS